MSAIHDMTLSSVKHPSTARSAGLPKVPVASEQLRQFLTNSIKMGNKAFKEQIDGSIAPFLEGFTTIGHGIYAAKKKLSQQFPFFLFWKQTTHICSPCVFRVPFCPQVNGHKKNCYTYPEHRGLITISSLFNPKFHFFQFFSELIMGIDYFVS